MIVRKGHLFASILYIQRDIFTTNLNYIIFKNGTERDLLFLRLLVENVLLGHLVTESNRQTADHSSLGGHTKLHQKDAGAHCAAVSVFVGSNQTGSYEASNA